MRHVKVKWVDDMNEKGRVTTQEMCSIKTLLIVKSLYRTKVSRISITEHWPTTIC